MDTKEDNTIAAAVGKKPMSQAEAMLNSEEIKPVILTILKLCLAEGISKLVENAVKWIS